MSSTLTLDFLKQEVQGPPLQAHPVPVPEFKAGMTAWIAELSADERDARMEAPWLAYKEKTGQESNVGLRAFMAAACLCQSQARDFVACDAAGIEELAKLLGKRDAKPVTRLFLKAQTVNGIGEDQVKELEKNSLPSGDGNGTSPLPLGSPARASGSDD